MKNISVLNKTDINIDDNVRTNFLRNTLPLRKTGINPEINNLIAEGDENFFDYLHWNGLANEANLMVLSSKNHYYYDSEELKDVTTLINLNQHDFKDV